MARPKQIQVRNKHVTFRVTMEELYRLTEKAVKSGSTVSDFARAKVLSARTSERRETATVVFTLGHEAFIELRRQGVNLNQIARHCNSHQVPPPPSLEPLLRAIRELLTARRGK